jgi:hypothetical protein
MEESERRVRNGQSYKIQRGKKYTTPGLAQVRSHKLRFASVCSRATQLQTEGVNLKRVGNAQAIFDADFPKDSMDMILHCLFGKIQLNRDFLISHAMFDQRNELFFASR